MPKLFDHFLSMLVPVAFGVSFSLLAVAQTVDSAPKNNPNSVINKTAAIIATLPPLASDMTDLAFNEFFKMPIGPHGLEPTEKLLNLNNKRVRVLGYMAEEEEPTPGLFMLAAQPVSVAEKADGMADDLSAATLFIRMPDQDAGKMLAHRSGLWVLTGTLQLGNEEEANGRTSFVRLIMAQRDIEGAKKIKRNTDKPVKK